MRILFVAHNVRDDRKGAAYADLSLLGVLRRRGHDVEERWDVGSPRRIRHDNLHLLLEAPFRCESAVKRLLRTSSPDVVIANQPLGYRISRLLERKPGRTVYVARSHGWEPFVAAARRAAGEGTGDRGLLRRTASRLLEPLLLHQNRLVLRGADGLVFASAEDLDGVAELEAFPLARMFALEPGVPREFLETAPREMTAERVQRLLYVGQFTAIKAPEVAAGAIARVLEENPRATATWVCNASDHASVMALFPAPVRPRVAPLPWLTRRELVAVYDEHGLFVFPSHFEGFGQTFMEAMARGLVVLATRVGGMKQVIRDGENGFGFERGDAAGIAERILALQRQPSLAGTVGTRAQAAAAELTWDRAGSRLETFLLGLVELGPRGRRLPGLV